MLPKWIIAPTNTEVVVGQNVIIDCTAMGDPRIWWEKAELTIEDSKPISNHFRTVISNSHIHTLENGSLTIREVSEEDEGEYMCQANNGVGSGLSKVVRLNVHGKFCSVFTDDDDSVSLRFSMHVFSGSLM
mgnify:CR=1 FL=1